MMENYFNISDLYSDSADHLRLLGHDISFLFLIYIIFVYEKNKIC